VKKKKKPEPYFKVCVDLFFKFVFENFNGEVPSFDNSAPRDLKNILTSLRTRAETKGIEWTEDECRRRFLSFLGYCKEDKFLGEAFILCNINRQKDKIFFQTAKKVKGGNNQVHRPSGNASLGDALRNY
jgi:hypothetical protein